MRPLISNLLIICFLTIPYYYGFNQNLSSGWVNLGVPPDSSPIDIARLVKKNDLVIGHDNILWYSTEAWHPSENLFLESWLLKYDLIEQSWQIFNSENTPLLPDTIYGLHVHENMLYVGTSGGVLTYDGSWGFIDSNNEMPDMHARTILVTHDEIFVGSYSGLSVLGGGVWTHYHTGNSALAGDTVNALALDHAGGLWVGTSTGLSHYSEGSWKSYTAGNSALEDHQINVVAVDHENHIWVGTEASGLYCVENETLYPFSEFYYLPISPTAVKSISINDMGEVFTGLQTAGGKNVSIKISNKTHQVYYYGAPGHYAFEGTHAYIGVTNGAGLFAYQLDEAMIYDNLNYLSINDVLADFSASGGIAYELGLHRQAIPAFEIPAGSGKGTLFTHRLWIGGLNEEGDLHLSADLYRLGGRDYWPGPVTYPQEYYQQEQEKWNRVWKIDRTTINHHRHNWFYADYEMPEVIRNWPAHGDTTRGQEWFMAPYWDRNANGIYEPHLGDYPIIRGDQALYFIFNDIRHENTESDGVPLGVEIRCMVYGFDAPESEALNTTFFVNYQIHNRSQTTYDSLYVGFLTHFDIGYGWDDYIGCDTLLSSYFGYNAYAVDGSGEPDTYGANPPAQAVTFLNQPLSSLIYIVHEPTMPIHSAPNFYNNLRGRWPYGKPLVWGGSGFPGGAGTTDEVVFHIFPDDPNNDEGWHEISIDNPPGDRRGIGSTYVGQFEPGQKICFDLAFVFGRDMEGDHLSSVSVMKDNIEQIKEFYGEFITDNCIDLTATDLIETEPLPISELRLAPNPAGTHVRIAYTPDGQIAHYRLFNGLGSMVQTGALQSANTIIDVSHLSPGVYVIVVQDGERYLRQKLIKH